MQERFKLLVEFGDGFLEPIDVLFDFVAQAVAGGGTASIFRGAADRRIISIGVSISASIDRSAGSASFLC